MTRRANDALPASSLDGASTDLGEVARRAATLFERLAGALRSDLPPPPQPSPIVAAWTRMFALGDAAALARRLAWDGLDLATVESRLAAHATGACVASWTGWIAPTVDQGLALLGERTSDPVPAEMRGLQPDSLPPFAEIWIPLVRCARRELERRTGSDLDRLSPDARRALEGSLLADVAAQAELALLERFRAFDGEPPPSGRYRRYIDAHLGEGVRRLFEDLPVLARGVVTLAQTWVESCAEMLSRLSRDTQAITAAFGLEPDVVVKIEPGRSDRHHGGRQVALLHFGSGLELAYKPRDVGAEDAFQAFLGMLRARGCDDVPAPLRVLARTGYGWMELAHHEELVSRDEAAVYFRRAGGLLCAAYVLRGRDLHQENVVATRHGPALVDAEALLAPEELGEGEAHAEGEGQGPSDTCLATGLLSLVQASADGAMLDLGGLRPGVPRPASLPWRRWHDLGSDDIGYTEEHTIFPALSNTAVLHGDAQEAEQYAAQIVQGFESIYRALLRLRPDLLAEEGGPLERLAGVRTRVLFRPSDHYGILLKLLASPRYQRDGTAVGLVLETLLRPFAREMTRPRLWPLVADERRALEALDVPCFTVSAGDGVLASSGGAEVTGQYVRTGIESVRRRMATLSEDDLAYQVALVTAALSHEERAVEAPAGIDSSRTAEGPDAVAAAERLGGAILGNARVEAQRLTWPMLGSRFDLYAGQAGPAVLLAALAAATQRGTWRDAAEDAFRALVDMTDATGLSGSLGIGSGTGSAVYALTLGARLLGRAAWLDAAERVARGLTAERIAVDVDLDVVDGTAGALLALLALHRHRPAAWLLDAARSCGVHLLARQTATLDQGAAWRGRDGVARSGFAHGAAGIALALGRLHAVDGDDRWQVAAREAFRHERALFSARDGSWPYVRPAGGTVPMVAWCHGAPGIGLARALAPSVADAEVDDEIRIAMETTSRATVSSFDHVCCGALAGAEALFSVGRLRGIAEWQGAGESRALAVAERVQQQGWRGARSGGYAHQVFQPTFFQGLSGIAYSLLRVAVPDVLPSVLGFETEGVVARGNDEA